jgi:twitching motility protein PilT
MLNWINKNYNKHILTLEDPIEFMFTEEKCLINQREIGQDVCDFEVGMKHAVREDPDVMLVGEMRDRETFETAIHAAETGPSRPLFCPAEVEIIYRTIRTKLK